MTVSDSSSERALEVRPGSDPAPLVVDVSRNIIDESRISLHLGQDVHVTTRDKVELGLRRALPRYTSTGQLLGVVGLFVALVTSLVTADFNDFMGVKGDIWNAGFFIGSLLSLVWMILEISRWLRRPSLDQLVDAVLNDADTSGK